MRKLFGFITFEPSSVGGEVTKEPHYLGSNPHGFKYSWSHSGPGIGHVAVGGKNSATVYLSYLKKKKAQAVYCAWVSPW